MRIINSTIIFLFSFIIIYFSLPLNNALALEYKGVGGRPAYPRPDNPRSESIFIYTVYPADKINDAIKIINNTDEIKTLMIYPVDSIVSTGGAFSCAQYVEPRNKVGSWIKVKKSEVTLAPQSFEIVPFTLQVPTNIDVGEHNGCLVVQEKKVAPKNKKQGINLSLRTGLRVALTVPGKIIKKIKLENYNVSYLENGKIMLQPKLKNIGNVSVDTDIQVLVYDMWGNIQDFHGGEFTILRDEEVNLNFEFKKPFLGGWFKTHFTAEYDSSINPEIGKKNWDKMTKLKSDELNFFVFPSWSGFFIGLLLLLLLLLILYLIYKYRQLKKWIKNEWVDYQIQLGDNIKVLADMSNVEWKTLAKANRLPPPYILWHGQYIKVPPNLRRYKSKYINKPFKYK